MQANLAQRDGLTSAACSRPASAQAVLVLGMHRSGTSLLARLLNLLGVELGADMLPPAADNPKGFWEHRRVSPLHDEIYELFGHDWKSVNELPPGWWEDHRVNPLRSKLRELVVRDFGKSLLWGMKDPRMCEMLPVWRSVLSELYIEPKCVLIVRNPIEVARSLEQRHGMPTSRAYLLWLRSLLGAERHSRGVRRTIISYDSLLKNWQCQMQNIGRQLDIEWPNSIDLAAPAVDEFIQPQLRHHEMHDQLFLHDPHAPELIRRAYAIALRGASHGNMDELSQGFDQIGHEIETNSPLLMPLVIDLDLQRRVAEKTAEGITSLQLETEKLKQQLVQVDVQRQVAENLVTQLTLVRSETADFQQQLIQTIGDAIRDRDRRVERLYDRMQRRNASRRAKKQRSIRKARLPIAVVIPYYNGSGFIERALESVFEQTVPADEVLVVNDGSKEEERIALHELGGRYPITIIDKANGGQGSARNTGVAASKSDYVCFLDQDDFYLPHHNEVLMDYVPRDDPRFGWVYGDLHGANGNGTVVQSSVIKWEHIRHPKRTIVEVIGADMFVLPSASLISRKAFDAVGGFDPQFVGYEDDDLFMRLFSKGFSNHFLDRPVSSWCMHTNSASYTPRMSRSRMLYLKKLMQLFPDEPRRELYYFRDCLMRRFGPMIFKDAMAAAQQRSDDHQFFVKILQEYAGEVYRNPSVSRIYKAKMRLNVDWISHAPPKALKIATTVNSLPGLRRMRLGIL